MIPLHLAWIRGGMAKPPLRCAMLVQEHAYRKKINLATVTIVAPPAGKRKRNSWVWKVMQLFEPSIRKCSVRCSEEVSKYRRQNVEADVCGFSLPGFWLRKSGWGATGSTLSSTPCSSFPRGRGDQLPSRAQFFFAVVLIGILRASMGPFKVAVNTIVPRSPFFSICTSKPTLFTHIKRNAVEYIRQ